MREQTSPVVSLWRGLFCDWGAALVTAGETHRLLRKKPNLRSGAPGRTVGEVVDKLKRDGCQTACTGTHDTQCVHLPCVLECVI